MGRRVIAAVLAATMLFSCGPRGQKKAPAQAERDFPYIVVPDMYEDPDDRVDYAVQHFWDRFLTGEPVYLSDSLHFNGVAKEELEKAAGTYFSLVKTAANAAEAMSSFHEKIYVYDTARGDNVYDELCRLTEKYLYNPSSPARDEELYLPFVSARTDSGRASASDRFAAKVCSLNRPGTRAADFGFIDTKGRRRTLYGIKAELIVLIFGHPDCEACREMVGYFSEIDGLSDAIRSGRIAIVDIYTDEDVAAWKAGVGNYPSDWLCGYDPEGLINSNTLYAVRAVPSIYLLDIDKTVIAKDIELSNLNYYLSSVL